MIPIGIRPINDFAFKKVFGSLGNTLPLISLLNSILKLPIPLVEVTLQNPFNEKDFQNDKLSILDIRAVDQNGVIYDIEMQLSATPGLVKRIVFYACEVYAGQMQAGDEYHELKPVFAICLLNGQLWQDSRRVHHAFQLINRDTGRCLSETLEVHTLELGWYNRSESDLQSASPLELWIFWLLHAHEYDVETLRHLFPDSAFWQATATIARIAELTEDKTMYDAREKALRDHQWQLNSARREGIEIGRQEGMEQGHQEGLQEGIDQGRKQEKIQVIQLFEEISGAPVTDEATLLQLSLQQLQLMTSQLRSRLSNGPAAGNTLDHNGQN